MPVRVTQDCRVGYNGALDDLVAGQEIPDGPFADYLLSTGAPVEAADADAPENGGPPPASAPKAEWVAHVVQARGLDEDEANALTKADLIGLVRDNGGNDAAPAGQPE